MRKILCLLTFLIAAAALASAQAAVPRSMSGTSTSQGVLADGTPVKLRVGAAINTSGLRVGDELELDVDEEVRVNDLAVIPTTSIAKVVVTSQAPDAAKTGKASVSLRYVFLVDGEKISLRPTRERKSSSSSTTVVSADNDITITNGAQITAYINGNLPLDFPKLRMASQPTHELKITTTPPNAEVSVDGKVLGPTPFSGRVASGEHVVAIRMAGFQLWHGTVRVTAEPTSLQIPLKKQDGLENVPAPTTAPPSLGELARVARAKKAAENGPKASGEPLELIPEEPKTPKEPQGTPQTPALHPEQPATTPAATPTPANGATATQDASQPSSTAPTTTPTETGSPSQPAGTQPTGTQPNATPSTSPSNTTPSSTPLPAAAPQATTGTGNSPQSAAPAQGASPLPTSTPTPQSNGTSSSGGSTSGSSSQSGAQNGSSEPAPSQNNSKPASSGQN